MAPEHIAAELLRLSRLKFVGWKESDVREEFIAPLLALLGYRRDTDYDINREDQHLLQRPFVRVGRTSIRIDYAALVRKQCFWLIEAKAPSDDIPVEDVDQAYHYAVHPEVRARFFVVCNGKRTDVYDTREPERALLSIATRELPLRFAELNAIIGAGAIVNHLHDQIEGDLRAVLAVEVREDRAQQLRARLSRVFTESAGTIRENRKAVVREKWSTIEADWRDLVESAQGSLQIANDVLLPELSLNDFAVAESAMHRWLASEDDSTRMRTVSKLIGLLSQPISSVRRFNVLRMLVRLRKKTDVASRRQDIDTAIVQAIKSGLSGFADAPHLVPAWHLEGLLFRALYKSMFCGSDAQRQLEAIVQHKLAMISDEERVHSEPTVESERLKIAHPIAVHAFLALSQLPTETIRQIVAELIVAEQSLEHEFSNAVEGKRNGLHLYASYGQPFDFMRSQLFHVLSSEFEDIVDLVDDEIVQQSCTLVAKLDAEETYALVHAESFVARILWYRNRVQWNCDRPAETFPQTLGSGVFIHRIRRPPVEEVSLRGPAAGGYFELIARLNLSEQMLEVGSARPMS